MNDETAVLTVEQILNNFTHCRVLRGLVQGKHRYQALFCPKFHNAGLVTSVWVFSEEDFTALGRDVARRAGAFD